MMPKNVQLVLSLITRVLFLVVAAILAYNGVIVAQLRMGLYYTTLRWPSGIAYIPLVIFGVCSCLFLLDKIVDLVKEIFHREERLADLSTAFIQAKTSLFTDIYGDLTTYEQVKYNPIAHIGTKFLLTGTAELDDYYNYDYRDMEALYFCVCVTPTGGGYSDRWYIYCERGEYAEFFDTLTQGPVSDIVLVCRGMFYDSIQHEMAGLVDYCMG